MQFGEVVDLDAVVRTVYMYCCTCIHYVHVFLYMYTLCTCIPVHVYIMYMYSCTCIHYVHVHVHVHVYIIAHSPIALHCTCILCRNFQQIHIQVHYTCILFYLRVNPLNRLHV